MICCDLIKHVLMITCIVVLDYGIYVLFKRNKIKLLRTIFIVFFFSRIRLHSLLYSAIIARFFNSTFKGFYFPTNLECYVFVHICPYEKTPDNTNVAGINVTQSTSMHLSLNENIWIGSMNIHTYTYLNCESQNQFE